MSDPERWPNGEVMPLALGTVAFVAGCSGTVNVLVESGHQIHVQPIESSDIPKVIAWLRARHKDNEEGKA